jgi:hypothetical protein
MSSATPGTEGGKWSTGWGGLVGADMRAWESFCSRRHEGVGELARHAMRVVSRPNFKFWSTGSKSPVCSCNASISNQSQMLPRTYDCLQAHDRFWFDMAATARAVFDNTAPRSTASSSRPLSQEPLPSIITAWFEAAPTPTLPLGPSHNSNQLIVDSRIKNSVRKAPQFKPKYKEFLIKTKR